MTNSVWCYVCVFNVASVQAVEGMILHEEEEMPIKLWDCDTVTQAKEKILDVLYRNTPVSKRPQLTEIDLGMLCCCCSGAGVAGGAGGGGSRDSVAAVVFNIVN